MKTVLFDLAVLTAETKLTAEQYTAAAKISNAILSISKQGVREIHCTAISQHGYTMGISEPYQLYTLSGKRGIDTYYLFSLPDRLNQSPLFELFRELGFGCDGGSDDVIDMLRIYW